MASGGIFYIFSLSLLFFGNAAILIGGKVVYIFTSWLPNTFTTTAKCKYNCKTEIMAEQRNTAAAMSDMLLAESFFFYFFRSNPKGVLALFLILLIHCDF
jgi:hypothetical protein